MKSTTTTAPSQGERPQEVERFEARLTIIAALQLAQNQIAARRPQGSSDPNSSDWDGEAQLWDTYQHAIDTAQTLGQPSPEINPSAGKTPTGRGWKVRERRSKDGELQDCFVEAPRAMNMAYGLEVLGDDYEGYGGVEAKMKHCQMIVAWANAEAHHE